MTTTVSDRCRAIATFRHVSVWLMETTARWTPTTPEMEAKVMFGRHIWDHAQMADSLGKRTFELRQAEHYTLRPVDTYAMLLSEVSAVQTTNDRIAALYEGVLPGITARYRRYLAAADAILDEPSVVIMNRIVRDLKRQCVEALALQRELNLAENQAGSAIARREQAIENIVADRVVP
jgi:hypothetical protein